MKKEIKGTYWPMDKSFVQKSKNEENTNRWFFIGVLFMWFYNYLFFCLQQVDVSMILWTCFGKIVSNQRRCPNESKKYQRVQGNYCSITWSRTACFRSSSAKGCPYDNSCIEPFHATIKKECIYAEANVGYKYFQTYYDSVFKYIEGFYNSRRRHSKLNYLCPNEFEKQIA